MEGFSDIEGPVPILVIWLISLLAAIGACGIGFLAWWLLRKRGTTEEKKAMIPERSPLEIAMDRLDHLKNSGETLDADPYTVEVSDIVRDYLQSSLRVPAKEQTSEEFLLSLQSGDHLPPVLKEHMPAFLDQCDWVKFARQNLGLEQRHGLLQTAETVVEVTNSHLRDQQTLSTSAS